MTDATPHRFRRSTLESLLERLPGWWFDQNGKRHSGDQAAIREVETGLFLLLDDRPVRKTRRAVLDTYPDNPLDCPDGQLPEPRINEDWVSELWEWPATMREDDGSITTIMACRTYTSPSGEQIQHAEYHLITNYLTQTEEAIWFKIWLVMNDLLLRTEETDRDWPSSYVATLLEGDTVVASHEAESMPPAIVGAVLKVMLSGWCGKLCSFEVLDE